MYQKVTAASLNSWWNPKTLHQYKNPSLGLYQPGDYPVPFWKYGPSCRLTPRRPGMKARRTLGDLPLYSQPPVNGSFINYLELPIAPPPDPNTIYSGIDAGIVTSAIQAPVPLPGVSASTLLQAAALPGAPQVVQQAAAQLQAASPLASFLNTSSVGIPNTYLLAGGALLLVVVIAASKKR